MHAGDVAGIDRSVTAGDSAALRDVVAPGEALELVSSLCLALHDAGIRYCHWKSNESLDRSASGENDLVLPRPSRGRPPVRGHPPRPWVQGRPAASVERAAGCLSLLRGRPETGHFVHIHAHYQLVIGDDMTKNYHLPIEAAYLASARPVTPFLVPAPEFELGLFLIRMVSSTAHGTPS